MNKSKILIIGLVVIAMSPSWASDPTRPDFVKPSVKSNVLVDQLRLTMVRMSDSKPSATINGQLLHLGDVIAGYRLSRITSKQVVLSNSKGQLRLNLITKGALKKSS